MKDFTDMLLCVSIMTLITVALFAAAMAALGVPLQ